MNRVEFTLTMPGNASWNGRWSGEDKPHRMWLNVTDARATRLGIGPGRPQSWTYAFGDGWVACVTARVMAPGERRGKTAGFSGYNWMVDSILAHGAIYANPPKPVTDPA